MKVLPYNKIPFLLKQISSCPYSLYCEGEVSLLERRCVTIVGTRKISRYGKYVIEKLLCDFLKDLGVAVVSGLALGVDAYVHEICLQRGIKTIAIVPGGLRSAIPKENTDILRELVRKGLVVAEFSEDIVFNRSMFVLRNRLLAGISDATLVVEAGLNSGSLITANFALEFNRDLYVIPGNINQNMSHGCNMLARDGAGVISCLDDFKEIFGVHADQILLKI